MSNFLQSTDNTITIQKGFVDGMHVPVTIYASEPLQKKLFDEHKDANSSFAQLANITTLPSVKAVYALPDLHQGYCFPIGSVSAFAKDGIISPEGVGFDINCGVRCYATNLMRNEIQPDALADLLFDAIPAGIGSSTNNISLQELNSILDNGIQHYVQKGMSENDLIESNGCMPGNSRLVSQKAKGKGMTQIKSLGSGNHYLEIQYVEEIYDIEAAKAMNITKKGQVVFMIHTGSRGLGHQVAQDYVNKINKNSKNESKTQSNKESENESKKEGKIESKKESNAESKNTKDADISITPGNSLTCAYTYYNTKTGQDYYAAMCSAANYAFCNRFLIGDAVNKILASTHASYKANLVYDVCHNIAKIEKHKIHNDSIEVIVHRKGASRSFPPGHPDVPAQYQQIGQPVFIGGSMGTCSYILVGQKESMTKSLGTACHGAGRVVPRKHAQKLYTYAEVVQELQGQGITVRCKSEKGLVEEAPGCYKNVDIVVDVCEKEKIAKRVVKVKPLIVIKG